MSQTFRGRGARDPHTLDQEESHRGDHEDVAHIMATSKADRFRVHLVVLSGKCHAIEWQLAETRILFSQLSLLGVIRPRGPESVNEKSVWLSCETPDDRRTPGGQYPP